MDEADNQSPSGPVDEERPKAGVADERVAQRAEEILRASPYHQLRKLRCQFCDGVLTICGDLPSFHMKQMAQIAVQKIDSVIRVDNQVTVR